ncbi:MAG TPA: serine/threonine-protein kinase [Desulfatiglandales bacterium]|nr:serine/threonine-protein kinase [Desulfatiglandales bacterium]
MTDRKDKTNILISAIVIVAFIYLSFMSFSFFESLEKIIYEMEMRLDAPRNPAESRVALVNIDDKSISKLGKWPWPRHIIAEMIKILKANGAKLIGLDMIFSEKEQNPGIQEIEILYDKIRDREKVSALKEGDNWILAELKEIEKRLDNDMVLSEAVKASGNIILPVVGEYGKYETELVIPPESFLHANTLKKDKIDIEEQITVNELLTPFQELSKNSHGMGHMNLSPDKIMTGQVHVPFINYRGLVIPSMPLRLALNYLNKHPEQVIVKESEIKIGKKTIPINKGEIFIKFKGGRRSFPYYSFVDILNVKKVPAVFDGKIVLIGFTSKGSVEVNTPVDPNMPRVEFMANVVEDFLTGRFLKRPSAMPYFEVFILLLFVLTSSFVQPRLSYLNRTAVTAGLIFLTFLTGAIFFIAFNAWFKTIYIILSLVVIYVIFTGKDLIYIGKTGISKEAAETNRMLGISLQGQGLLDLAFEKFRKSPLDDEMRDIIYNLGLNYERKRMINKAISIYEYINKKDEGFRDLNERIPKLKKVISSMPLGAYQGKKEEKIIVSDDLEVKPTVGRYEILMELGRGAMGTVYKGRDPKINRLLAIKTIRFSDEFEENQLREIKDRFFREAELAGKLSYPGIVAIYDVGEDYDLTYMAMEFLDGEDLEKYCKKESLLPIRKLINVITETADALEYAHNNGVIHRDIKPANIMLLKNGKIKVTDFGIAKSMSSSKTRSGIILGTPNYMSPEQIMGRKIDSRSDIFSLGVVFFQLLTGELPFRGDNLNSLFYQITQVKHTSSRKINPRVIKPIEQIIDKALSKNPDHRFQHARDLSKYLKILAGKIDSLRMQKSKHSIAVASHEK